MNNYSWPQPTVSGGTVTGDVAGSGTPIAQTLVNTGTTPATVTYTVTGSTGTGATITYSDAFVQGVTPTTQATDWTTFETALTSQTYTSCTIKGSQDNVGRTCNNSAIVTALANALHT